MLKKNTCTYLKGIAVIFVILLGSLTGASAASLGDCMSGCGICGDDPVCETIYENCINRCKQGSAPAQAPGVWGAIAVSGSAAYTGWSWNCQSKQEAANKALRYCWQAMNAMRDCNVVATFANTCIALATSPKERAWGYGHNDSPKQARKRALMECREGGGRSCRIVSAYCSPKN